MPSSTLPLPTHPAPMGPVLQQEHASLLQARRQMLKHIEEGRFTESQMETALLSNAGALTRLAARAWDATDLPSSLVRLLPLGLLSNRQGLGL